MTSIKVINGRHNGQTDVRRLKVDNWQDAVDQIQSRFNVQSFTARYIDEDGDYVTISTEDDFQEALSEAKGILRVLLGNVEKNSSNNINTENNTTTPKRNVDDQVGGDDAGMEGSVLVEPVDESVEPKVEEPEDVQPVVTESEEDSAAQQDQATVEALEPDEQHEHGDQSNHKTDTDVHVNEDGEIELESELNTSDNASASAGADTPTPQPTFFECLFKGLESMNQQGNNSDDPIAQMAGSMASEVVPGIMEGLMGGLAHMNVPESNPNPSASCDSGECSESCECNGDCTAQSTAQPAETRNATEDSEGNTVHEGVTCDECDKTIVGNRYKCRKCPDFDLCELCLASVGHDESHPLVLFRVPRVRRGFCGYGNHNNNNKTGRHHGNRCQRPRGPPPAHGRPPHADTHAPPPPPPPPHHAFGPGAAPFTPFGPGAAPFPPHMHHGAPPPMFGGPPPPPPQGFGMGMGFGPFGPFEVNTGQAHSSGGAQNNRRGAPAAGPNGMDALNAFMTAMFAPQSRGTQANGSSKAKASDTQSKTTETKGCGKSRRCEKKESSLQKPAEVSESTNTAKGPVVEEEDSVPEKPTVATSTPPTPATPQEEFVVVESVSDVEDEKPSSTSETAEVSKGTGSTSAKGKESKNVEIMNQLYEMGFTDRSLNAAYIRMYGSDVNEIASRLAERK